MNLAPKFARRFWGASLHFGGMLAAGLAVNAAMNAQEAVQNAQPAPTAASTPATPVNPIAIVPVDSTTTVTGAFEVSAGRAMITTSGSITSGDKTTNVVLPYRGILRVCTSSTVKVAADTSVPAGETPGLMMALDHGAIEASFATARNSDILLTPDFRILIGGPGAAEVKVRLGQHGDTCVDNAGLDAPYVLVTSVFEGGAYRVQPGQRVMFQHGSLQEVVDQEKEPCGCPQAPQPGTNEFPVAQSAGLAPLPQPAPVPVPAPAVAASPTQQPPSEPLVYQAPTAQPAPDIQTPKPAPVTQPLPGTAKQDKPGIFHRIGRFFKRIFGAE